MWFLIWCYFICTMIKQSLKVSALQLTKRWPWTHIFLVKCGKKKNTFSVFPSYIIWCWFLSVCYTDAANTYTREPTAQISADDLKQALSSCIIHFFHPMITNFREFVVMTGKFCWSADLRAINPVCSVGPPPEEVRQTWLQDQKCHKIKNNNP